MHFHELYNNVKAVRAISPVSVGDNTAQNSVIIDRRDYNAVLFVIALGSIADADATFAVTLVHGDAVDSESSPTSITDAAAVASTDLIGTLAEAGFQFDSDNGTRKLGYRGIKRWLQLTITPSNNASAALMSCVCLLARPSTLPVS